MDKEFVYEDLIRQYNLLEDEEKNSIIIYKSGLFFHINTLSTIDNFNKLSSKQIFDLLKDKDTFINKYVDYKNIIDSPNNVFLKYSLFKNVNFDNIKSFIESIKKIYETLDSLKNKIVLESDLIVYRGCSYDENDDEYNLSKGNLISTSIDINIVEKFLFTKEKNKLYKIILKKGTPVMVTPYSIVNLYDTKTDMLMGNKSKQLKMIKNNFHSQKELILYKDTLNLSLVENRIIDDLEVDTIDTNVKENEPKKIRSI